MYEESDGLTRFRLGEDVGEVPGETSGAGPDLPRNMPRRSGDVENFFGRALIGDPRNDENLLVSQLHCTMLRFHNKVTDAVAQQSPLTGDNLFKEVQRLVRWHYQWVVVHDYLPRIVGQAVVDDILRIEELVVGGHGRPPIAPCARVPLLRPQLRAVHAGGVRRRGLPLRPLDDPRPVLLQRLREERHRQPADPDLRPRGPAGRAVQPQRLPPPARAVGRRVEVPVRPARVGHRAAAQPADRHSLAGPLADLPRSIAKDPPHSLAERNLQRGLRLALLSGTAVARAMGMTPLSANELGIGDLDAALGEHPPLWFYVLKEAELLEGGRMLGPVGAHRRRGPAGPAGPRPAVLPQRRAQLDAGAADGQGRRQLRHAAAAPLRHAALTGHRVGPPPGGEGRMALLDEVRAVCGRLAPLGWADLLAAHGWTSRRPIWVRSWPAR